MLALTLPASLPEDQVSSVNILVTQAWTSDQTLFFSRKISGRAAVGASRFSLVNLLANAHFSAPVLASHWVTTQVMVSYCNPMKHNFDNITIIIMQQSRS
jgi:hypothetical protein